MLLILASPLAGLLALPATDGPAAPPVTAGAAGHRAPGATPVTSAVTLRAWTSPSPPKPRTSAAGCGTSCASRSSPPSPSTSEWRAARGHDDHEHPPVLEELKAEARKRGLWNLFHHELGGLSNLEYASVAEITGWSPTIAPEAINCGAPGHRQHGDAHAVRHRRAEAALAEAAAGGRDPLRRSR